LQTRTGKHISMLCYLRNYPFRRSSDTEFKLLKHANEKKRVITFEHQLLISFFL
jgi:hypothetical protein